MDFLRENRNLVILVALAVILYLLWDVAVVRNLRTTVMSQWNGLGNTGRVVLVLAVAVALYWLWSRE